MSKRSTVLILLAGVMYAGAMYAGETLYNGIELPDKWPPVCDRHPKQTQMPVPYQQNPPAVIPIDIGRQLLVDDFLIEKTTLKRTFYTAEYHPTNPVIKPDKPWEFGSGGWFAAPFSGRIGTTDETNCDDTTSDARSNFSAAGRCETVDDVRRRYGPAT